MNGCWKGGLLGLCLLGTTAIRAGEEPESVAASEDPAVLSRLKTLTPGLERARENLETARARLDEAETDQERAEAEAEVDAARARVETLREDFMSLASGIDEDRFLGKEEEPLSIQQTLQDILEPISRSVREATSEPRETEEIRQNLEEARGRESLAGRALERLDELRSRVGEGPVLDELEKAWELWVDRRESARVRADILEQQLAFRQGDERSTLDKVSEFFRDFWRSRGLNLIFAVLAAVLSVMIVRRGAGLLTRALPKKRRGGLAGRTTNLAVQMAAGLTAVFAVLLVFYLRGDWLLLAIVIVAILGLLWASRQALPPYVEQIRVILNLGSVREGERMDYEGVPYQVKRLNFRCFFENPELEGGRLRLPVRDVIQRVSRPVGRDEPWFPTEVNDWVVLGDETFGKVVHQSPGQVVVLRLGGSRKIYPTADFLELSPENLSRGYRVKVTFGLDYAHQAIATGEVPEVFREALERGLAEFFDADAIRSVKVEFASAGASSLDYEILADFDGSLASRRNVIRRRIQSICVDVCNDRGWGIPFTQLTLHHRGGGPE